MSEKRFNDFTWWLNLTQSNQIPDSDFTIAKNVLYNNAKQLQTRRGIRTFWNQIGSDPITSYYFTVNDLTGVKTALCTSGTNMYLFDWTTRNAITTDNLLAYETSWITTRRTRRDFITYKNVVYCCDWVNPYSSITAWVFWQIGLWSAITVTVNTATDVFDTGWPATGLVDGDQVMFTSATTMPAPLVKYQVYYAVSCAWTTFKLANTIWGTAIDITTAGTGTIQYKEISQPRPRYIQLLDLTCFTGWFVNDPNIIYYSNSLPIDLTVINSNSQTIWSQDWWVINWISQYNQLPLILKSSKIYTFNYLSTPPLVEAVDTQGWWYSNRVIKNVWDSLVYLNERWIDNLVKRSWVDGAWAIETRSLSTKVRPLTDTIDTVSYNSNTAIYIKPLNNYYFSFDTNWDDKPDTTIVYSSNTGGRTQYNYPNLYDYWYYINSSNETQYLFASANGWQMYEMEYWFDDNGVPIDAEIQTKKFDFGAPNQYKTFSYMDITGRKQQSWEITATIYVDDSVAGSWVITDNNLNLNSNTQVLWVRPLWVDVLWSSGVGDLVLYPFTVRVPFFSRWSAIYLNLQSSWVQRIFEKMVVNVDWENIDVFDYWNII